MIDPQTKLFLKESNAIENVWDDESLMYAVKAWNYTRRMKNLDVTTVLTTHKILMTNQPLRHDQKGYFRKEPVWIAGREGKPWFAIPELIFDWCFKLRLEKPLFTEKYAEAMHVEYERIHPFADGNGRTGRIFLNWHRLKMGLPLLVLKESEKHAYYKWFE